MVLMATKPEEKIRETVGILLHKISITSIMGN